MLARRRVTLGFLPLGLAREPNSDRQYSDTYKIITAPSLQTLVAASRLLNLAQPASLAVAVNPTGDIPSLSLPFAEIEGALVASHFVNSVTLDKSDATPALVLAALQDKSY